MLWLSSGSDIVAFLGLSRLLGALHLSGELFQLFQQTLVGETECLHLIDAVMHGFQSALRRSAASLGDWRGSFLCSGLIA